MRRYLMMVLAAGVLIPTMVLLMACGGRQTTPAVPGSWQWPRTLNMLAIGTSGMTKTVSWASVMEASTGTTIRVQSEESYAHAGRLMKQQKFPLAEFSSSTLGSMIEAIDEYALKDGGPWIPGIVWSASFGSTGFLVRGDSVIRVPQDIRPGMKMAVSRKTTGMLRMYQALLAWAQVREQDMLWLETGDTPSAVRAVVDGRADLVMCPPTGEYVYEAVAAPYSARFIDLNSVKDPQGALRFQDVGPMYGFAPIRNGPKQVQGTWSVSGPRAYWSYYEADPELIYNIAKWLDENYDKYKDRFDSNVWMTMDILKDAIAEMFTPVHPGLKRYLIEKGIWNDIYEKRDKYNYDLCKTYVDAYAKAVTAAEAQGITVTPSNAKWLEFWENYKIQNKMVMLRKHPSLEVSAPVTYYKHPATASETSAPASSPTPAAQPPASTDVPIQVVSAEGVHPGSKAKVIVKTSPGAEITIQVTLPGTGTISAYPADKTKTAGSDGTVTWEWDVSERTRKGQGIFTFTAKKDGKEGVLVHKIEF